MKKIGMYLPKPDKILMELNSNNYLIGKISKWLISIYGRSIILN